MSSTVCIVPQGKTEWGLIGRQLLILYKEFIFNETGAYIK